MLTCCLHEILHDPKCTAHPARTTVFTGILLCTYFWPMACYMYKFLAPNGSGSYSICVFNGDFLSIPKNQSKEAV